jgi:hypothetical protein
MSPVGRSVNIVAEDILSETVLQAILSQARGKLKVANRFPIKKGWEHGIGPSGYGYIKKNLRGFNAAAATTPFIVLVDADDRGCPPGTIVDWLSGATRHPQLIVRIAIREVEAWLLADRAALSDFLVVSEKCIPVQTARIKDPKRYIVRLAARSRRMAIRDQMCPAPNSRAKVGPYYNQTLRRFVRDFWDAARAATCSDSLLRAVRAIDAL